MDGSVEMRHIVRGVSEPALCNSAACSKMAGADVPRILFSIYEDLTRAAGSTIHVRQLAAALKDRGHDVYTVSPLLGRGGALLTTPTRLYPLPRSRVMRVLAQPIFCAAVLDRACGSFKPDRIVFWNYHVSPAELWAARRHGVPCLSYMNGYIGEEHGERRGFVERLGRRWVEWTYRAAAPRFRIILTVTPELRSILCERYGLDSSRIHILRNAVDTAQFRPGVSPDAAENTPLAGTERTVGFIGTFHPWHGLEYLVEAVPQILKEEPFTRFLLVGDGQERVTLEERVHALGVGHAVKFTGMVPFETVPEHIRACDVCIVFFKPVRRNPGDPIKLYEYLASGKPVVTDATPGYGDVVRAAGAGVVVDPRNPSELAGAVVDLLRRPDLRREMGESGRNFVMQGHTWAHRAEELGKYLFDATPLAPSQ